MINQTYTFRFSSGLLGQSLFHIDLVASALNFLILLLVWTSFSGDQTRRKFSRKTIFSLCLGSGLLVLANDVLLLMAGAAISSIGLLVCSLQTRNDSIAPQQSSTLILSSIGWSLFFAGLAWLVACAAIVRAAPHGLPGMTTINLNELVQLILRASKQHPAAKMTWEQYQLVPTLAVFSGVAVLGGLIPFHSLFIRKFENGSFVTRIWMIAIAKISMLLFYRLFISPDPAGWASTALFLTLPLMFSFVYVSYLIYSAPDSPLHLSRFVVWSQQWTMLGWCVLPDVGDEVLWLSSIIQFAGLILLCLVLEFAKNQAETRLYPAKFIGVMSVGGTGSLAGLFLVWNISLQLSASTNFGAAAFVLFAIALLISVGGFLQFLQRPIEVEDSYSKQLAMNQKTLIFSWSLVAVLGSFLSLYL